MIQPKKKVKRDFFYGAVGRRKSSVCTVRLYPVDKKETLMNGKTMKAGEIMINNTPVAAYFGGAVFKKKYQQPFELVNSMERFVTLAKIVGGGKMGQMDSFTLAVSRALQKIDPSYRQVLKVEGLLSMDSRIRERRKVGMGGKARRPRQSPKR